MGDKKAHEGLQLGKEDSICNTGMRCSKLVGVGFTGVEGIPAGSPKGM